MLSRCATVVFMGTLIYDADCGFCTTSAMWLAKRDTFEPQAWQFVDDLAALGLDVEMVTTAAQWVEGGVLTASGSDAIGKAMISRGGFAAPLGHIVLNFPIRPIARQVYKRIAKNRHLMPGGSAACKIPNA